MTELERRIAEIEASGVSGPNKLAMVCEAMIPHLVAEREAAKSDTERKQLSVRLKTNTGLLRWAKTRAGYVQPVRPAAQAAANKLARKAAVPSAEEE